MKQDAASRPATAAALVDGALDAVRYAELGSLPDVFPDDVADAVRTAQHLRSIMTLPGDPATEPWPPMRMKARP